MDPPKTPITPDTYKKMGLPFYHLTRGECQPDGVSGAWGAVKGAKETASWNMKSSWKKEQAKSGEPGASAHGETGDWALLEWGAFSELSQGREEGDFSEPSFDFPIELLDVDDTIPKFTSVRTEEESAGWDEDDLYD